MYFQKSIMTHRLYLSLSVMIVLAAVFYTGETISIGKASVEHTDHEKTDEGLHNAVVRDFVHDQNEEKREKQEHANVEGDGIDKKNHLLALSKSRMQEKDGKNELSENSRDSMWNNNWKNNWQQKYQYGWKQPKRTEYVDEDGIIQQIDENEKRNRFLAMLKNRNQDPYKRAQVMEDEENEEKRNRFVAMLRGRNPKRNSLMDLEDPAADEEKRNRFLAMMRHKPKRMMESDDESFESELENSEEKRNRFLAMLRQNKLTPKRDDSNEFVDELEVPYTMEDKRYISLNGDVYDSTEKRADESEAEERQWQMNSYPQRHLLPSPEFKAVKKVNWEELAEDWQNNQDVEP